MATLELDTVTLSVSDRVAWITQNRPDALNAWTRQLGEEMLAALERADADEEVRAVVLTGAGRAFSSGADLKGGGVQLTPEGKVDVLTPLREVYNPLILRVREFGKPTIAAVNGPAVGIGWALALACDLIVAAQSAYFLLAFANIGLSVDGGASVTLAARAGHTRAAEIALLADRISAERALDWGLVNRVVADDQLQPEVSEIAARLAAGPPGSYSSIKQSLNRVWYGDFAAALDAEAVLQQRRAESADFAEGVLAFLQKRSAEFTGR
ncbi:MAG TPA: enoyl-CoA hydratase [Solirubrobacteraceae bacterium]|jgi:2-(1,2-epoxy-1,2-dihydrophenyl)acetyl-CoA isomerase|nr:enoyl-CoA hydratase [Solirubrobacteraceae bacterium]